MIKQWLLWPLFWLFIAFTLFAGLDNLFFQPPLPGILIGVAPLCSVAFLLYQVKQVRQRRDQ